MSTIHIAQQISLSGLIQNSLNVIPLCASHLSDVINNYKNVCTSKQKDLLIKHYLKLKKMRKCNPFYI